MKTLLASLALLLLCSTTRGFAQPGDDGPGAGRRELPLRELRATMQLTDTQVQSLGDIRRESQKSMIDLRSSIQKKRIDLRAIMASDKPVRADVERLAREIADLQVNQRMLMFDGDQKVMQVLTPEQQKKWKELREERGQRFRRGMKEEMRGGRQRKGRD